MRSSKTFFSNVPGRNFIFYVQHNYFYIDLRYLNLKFVKLALETICFHNFEYKLSFVFSSQWRFGHLSLRNRIITSLRKRVKAGRNEKNIFSNISKTLYLFRFATSKNTEILCQQSDEKLMAKRDNNVGIFSLTRDRSHAWIT